MEKRYLAFDLGAESGRAIAGTWKDGRLELDEIHRFPTQQLIVGGALHWNVYRFFEEIKTGIKKYVQKYGPEVEGLGVDTWGVDYGLLDETGELLGLPYHYRDPKNNGSDALLREKMDDERLYSLTGTQFMTINSVNQLVVDLKRGLPILREARHLLFMGDLLHYFLTGQICSEYTLASISQMYNQAKGEWADEVFAAFGIPEVLKTRVIFAGDKVGALHDHIADETGLMRGADVIAPAVHDTSSAVVAVPVDTRSGWAFISSGTWSLVGLELDKPVITPESLAMNLANEGGALRKNLFLKNVMGLWPIQRCKRAWNKKDPALDYARIQELAAAAKPFAAIIDVDDPVFLNPEDMPAEIVEYIQKTGQGDFDPDDMGQIARIVFESLALKYRSVLEKLAKSAGQALKTVHILGGGSQNTLLNQFAADACDMRVTAGPVEATAIGNIMMQAYGKGEFTSLEEIRRAVAASFTPVEFIPEHTDAWEGAYQRFTALFRG